MRRIRNMSAVRVLVLVVALSFVVGCATFKQNTYNTLYVAGVAYDTTMSMAGDLYKQGKLTVAQKDEVVKYATPFYSAYHAAVDAFEVWNKTQTVSAKDKMVTAMLEMMKKAGDLKGYLNRLNISSFNSVLDKLNELSELVKRVT